MKLPLKITLLLFAVIALLIGIIAIYFFWRIEENFNRQAEQQIEQSAAVVDQRLQFLQASLETEMNSLAASVFTENEDVLASILAMPPDFNAEVIHFAEKLRRRATLHFLLLLNADHIVISNSGYPAAFGKPDDNPQFPLDTPAYLFQNSVRLELKKKAVFGSRVLYLRGGFFLKQEMEKLPLNGIRMQFLEVDPSSPQEVPAFDPNDFVRNIPLNDYRGNLVATIRIVTSRQPLIEEKQRLIRHSTIFIATAFLVCLLIGYFLSLGISRPVTRLRDAAAEMSRGNLEVRVAEGETGEIGELIRAFNQMASELEEKQRALAQSERIAAWQEIARHLAHEIKNPLTPIRTSIANLRLSMEKAPEKFPEIFLESSESILEEVEKLRQLADEFARFARLPAPNKKTGNLNEVIHKNLALYNGTPVEMDFRAGSIPSFAFDAAQISEVIHNLLQNAVDAVGSNGMIRVDTATLNQNDRTWIQLIVEDNGKGMAEEVRSQIFTPYFTTKDKGTGLGLAIVQRIVTEHGGIILVESSPGKGTRFEVRLPTGNEKQEGPGS